MDATPQEKIEIAAAISSLTGLNFVVLDGKVAAQRMTTEGFNRLNHLCQTYGASLRVLITGENGGAEVESADLIFLRRLNERETKREAKSGDVSKMLKALTGLDWQWNGRFHHVPFNLTNQSIPQSIFKLQREGVIVGDSGFKARLDGREELEIHAVDFTKLKAKYDALERKQG